MCPFLKPHIVATETCLTNEQFVAFRGKFSELGVWLKK